MQGDNEMYAAEISLNGASNVDIADVHSATSADTPAQNPIQEDEPSVSLLGKARSRRLASLGRLTITEPDLRLENSLLNHDRSQHRFEEVDHVVKQLFMHEEAFAAE